MHKFYYQVKKESYLNRMYRKYGWIIWLILAILILIESERIDGINHYFKFLGYIILALLNIPWKKEKIPCVELDDNGISNVMPNTGEFTQLLWKDITKVFYTTDGGISFYHGSDFTFFIPIRQLSDADKNALIEIVKQKLSHGVMGLEKL